MSNGHEDETRLEDVVSWTPSAILQKMVTRQQIPGCILRRMEDGLSSALIRNPLIALEGSDLLHRMTSVNTGLRERCTTDSTVRYRW